MKKDGSLRFCAVYQKLNEQTKPQTYPLPQIEDTLDCLHGAQYLATLNFLRILADPDEEGQHRVGFFLPGRPLWVLEDTLRFQNAPTTLQWALDLWMAVLSWEEVSVPRWPDYLHSNLWGVLIQLEIAFQWLKKADLTLKPSKCFLDIAQCNIWAMQSANNAFSLTLRKWQQYSDVLCPTNREEVHSFET